MIQVLPLFFYPFVSTFMIASKFYSNIFNYNKSTATLTIEDRTEKIHSMMPWERR